MILTTKSGVRIDVESFVNCKYGYDIKCEVVCEEGTINLPEPANAMIRTNASRVTPICSDWSQRFVDAYNVEFQEWINATKAGGLMVRRPGTATSAKPLPKLLPRPAKPEPWSILKSRTARSFTVKHFTGGTIP